jgi:hypothetical protein
LELEAYILTSSWLSVKFAHSADAPTMAAAPGDG